MPRSKLDTLIYATILLTPMAVAAGYLAFTPAPAPIVIVEPAPASGCPAPASVCPEPAPAPTSEPSAPSEPTVPVAVEPVATDPPSPIDPSIALAGAGMLLYDGQLVLSTAPDLSWSKGQLRNHPREWAVEVSKRVDVARLPDPLRALADARIIVHAADGSTCTATTRPDGLTIFGRQDGELAYPEDDNDELTPAQRLAIREQVFAEAQLLRGRLHRDEGRCEGVWARAAALPAPAVFAAREQDEPDATLRAQILAQLAGMPQIETLARAYRHHNAESGAEQPAWSVYLKDTLHMTRWDELGGTRSYLNVIVGDGGEACSSLFSDQVAVLFRLDSGEPVAQDDPGFLHPLAVMDLERDGHLEAVTENGLQLESRGPNSTLQRFEIPYHGCPC